MKINIPPDYLKAKASDLSDESNRILASLDQIHRIFSELDELDIAVLQDKIQKQRQMEDDFRKYVDHLQEIEHMLIEISNMFPPALPFSPIIKL